MHRPVHASCSLERLEPEFIMRIVPVMDHSVPGTDGYAIRAKYLLEAQAKAGHQVTVLTSPSQGAIAAEQSIDGVHYRRSHYTDFQSSVVKWGGKQFVFGSAIGHRLSQLLDEQPFDIVHAHTPFTVARPALAQARKRGLPFVYEKRNLWEESARARGKRSGRWPFFQLAKAMDSFVTRHADAVCVITEALKRRTVEVGVEQARIFVVGNGVDTEAFQPVEAAPELRQRCLSGGDYVLGFVGSFFKFEGLPLLVRAFEQVHTDYPGARLVLVGDGEDHASVQALVSQLELDDVVWLTGRVPHAQVESFYASMDALVYPRLRSELTELISPLKPLEPMAMARCVVGSDVGGIRELIQHGQSGLLFEADSIASLVEQLRGLLSRRIDAASLGRRARERMVAVRQWKHMASVYDMAYEYAARRSLANV